MISALKRYNRKITNFKPFLKTSLCAFQQPFFLLIDEIYFHVFIAAVRAIKSIFSRRFNGYFLENNHFQTTFP